MLNFFYAFITRNSKRVIHLCVNLTAYLRLFRTEITKKFAKKLIKNEYS